MAETTLLLPSATNSNTFRKVPPGDSPAHTRINSGVSTPTFGSYLLAELTPRSVDVDFPVPGPNRATSSLRVRLYVEAQFEPLDEAQFTYSLYLNGSLFETSTLYVANPNIPVIVQRTIPIPDLELTSARMLISVPNVGPAVPQAQVFEAEMRATWEYIQKTTVCVSGSFGTEQSLGGSIPEC